MIFKHNIFHKSSFIVKHEYDDFCQTSFDSNKHCKDVLSVMFVQGVDPVFKG